LEKHMRDWPRFSLTGLIFCFMFECKLYIWEYMIKCIAVLPYTCIKNHVHSCH
jgi:hypothetical protein